MTAASGALRSPATGSDLKGLEIEGVLQNNTLNHESWAVYVTGSDDIFEQLNTHNNMGPGIFIQDGDANLILNCDSHDNYDPNSSDGAGNNADGFGIHTLTDGTVGNVISGCRSWWNSDDGFDCIDNHQPVLVENCWDWFNGYLPGQMKPAPAGNGNGFKIGGYDMPPAGYPTPQPQYTVHNCLAYSNTAAGFYQNHELIPDIFYNNTSYKNQGGDFNLLGYSLATKAGETMGILKNNVAYGGTLLTNTNVGTPDVTEANNSWDLVPAITVTDADFLSVDTTGITGPRQADGSLPNIKFMHLVAGSHLIGKGVNVGLPYSGNAPDLGCFPMPPPALPAGRRYAAGPDEPAYRQIAAGPADFRLDRPLYYRGQRRLSAGEAAYLSGAGRGKRRL